MSREIVLLNIAMHDGSRQFLELPEVFPWETLRDHLASLPGAEVTGFLTDEVTEVWLDFTFRGHHFTVNNQFGEFWYFVRDPECPDEVLYEVARHCSPPGSS